MKTFKGLTGTGKTFNLRNDFLKKFNDGDFNNKNVFFIDIDEKNIIAENKGFIEKIINNHNFIKIEDDIQDYISKEYLNKKTNINIFGNYKNYDKNTNIIYINLSEISDLGISAKEFEVTKILENILIKDDYIFIDNNISSSLESIKNLKGNLFVTSWGK